MKKFSTNSLLKRVSVLRIASLIIILIIFLSSSFLIPNSNNITEIDRDYNSFSQMPLIADADSFLFEGTENALNLTDYGNLYKFDQEVSLTNQEELNLTYYLDDVNNWKISTIENEISNVQDTRNWANNSDFISANIYRVNKTVQSDHDPYNPDENLSPPEKINQTGAFAMRAHFVNMSFTEDWDYLIIEDESSSREFCTTGVKENFFSPWIYGEELNLAYRSDSFDDGNEYGYYVDYYEFINDSSYFSNSESWGFNSDSTYGASFGPGTADNASGMYVKFDGSQYWDGSAYRSQYEKDDFAEIYQNITVPRGQVIDGYISFNYNAESCLATSNNFIYAAINGQKIFSIGFIDVVDKGRNTWYSTGQINKLLWVNTSTIFENPIINQNINISFGIKSGSSTRYGGYEDRFHQIVWFDNVTLGLTTISNSSQDGINLTLNTISLSNGNNWGCSEITLNNTWESNPVILTVNTTSPSLTFDLNTTLYGFHNTTSKINQQNDDGIKYRILENGSIYWEFYHNLYHPSQYEDFHFTINKPENWEFVSVLDPTLQLREFEGGSAGDKYLIVNSTNAIFPGWWTFQATSPNYFSQSNTKLLKQGEWTHTSFITGESTRIKTQVNYSGEIPNNIESTEVNLTIFDPEGNQWYSEVNSPLSNGTVFFSEVTFAALNTTGGQFDYTLLWSNGTALGGIKSNFIVNHQSQIKLLKPDDAKIDLRTDGYVGDIIPVRIILTDPENGLSISGAIITYNWAGGTTHNFTEAAIGVYETILDTGDLSSRGLYEILISSSKLGFTESSLTIEINLGEEFDLVWIIILISALIISVLGIMSLRAYVIMPRRRKKEAELLSRTQRFKDIQNIQAIVAIHRLSGIPLYSKSYSILEKHKKELFSGFVQAIVTVGEEMVDKKKADRDLAKLDDSDGSRTILELDFKYFYCLICDREDLRIIFILNEKASDRLKKQISDLSLGAMLELSEQLENWDGAIHEFESKFPPIINDYVELFFKETFMINNAEFIAKIRKEGELNSMETRILNVIYSIAKSKKEFYLKTIFEVVHEKNQDLIIDAIETLINKQVIIPSNK